MWGTFLSEPLPIDATVGRYPAVKLIGRIPIRNRPEPLLHFRCLLWRPWGISLTFARLSPSGGQVGYALLTRAPVDAHQKQAFDVVSPRLACVKPVASVHPEPGSNSPL